MLTRTRTLPAFPALLQDVFIVCHLSLNRKLDHFTLCCYAIKSVPDVKCDSPADEYSSCDDLMKNRTLQVCIWILGILAFLGNLFVVVWRLFVNEDNRVNSLLLSSLAVSDFLMGVYLLIIAIKDAEWRGEYFLHDLQWRASFLCQCAGILSMLSSEVSVIMLTIMTSDRLVSIVFPFTFKSLSLKKARVVCVLGWIVGGLFAVLPVLGMSYFHDEKNDVGFYGRSAVCLPLQLSSEKLAGWEYSVVVFIGFNTVSFLFIMGAYVVMFTTVYRISKGLGSSRAKRDATVAKRMMFIVLTDFCCWMPVIIIGLLSLTGNFHDPTKKVYVWIAVFVLPVNSSINPILYTFSTRPAMKRIQFCRKTVSSLISQGRRHVTSAAGKNSYVVAKESGLWQQTSTYRG